MEKSPKISNIFFCKACQYKCSKPSEFYKHERTQKHYRLTNTNLDESKNLQYFCSCGKQYKHMSSLCNHKKKCDFINRQPTMSHSNEPSIDNNIILPNLVLEIIKTNSELQKQCIELQKQNKEFQEKMLVSFQEVIKNGTNNTITNSHNKTFNLQFFLNETCKDAMNIMDFVDSVKLQLNDLENIGNTGFVSGISNIIIKNLKEMDVTKRPLHCTDSKREVLYVKDENKWEKENEEKEKMKKVINQISNKNIQQIPQWIKENPKYKDSDSNKNTEYLQIVNESMGCTDKDNYNKIIHNISKEVLVDK